jgi:hypothetical protein
MLKSFVETLTPINQIPIFEEQLCMPKCIFLFDTDWAQINSVVTDS